MMLSTWPCSNRTVSIKQGSNKDLSDENSVESRGFRGSMSKISEIQILYSVHSRDICNELPLLVSLCMRKDIYVRYRQYVCTCAAAGTGMTPSLQCRSDSGLPSIWHFLTVGTAATVGGQHPFPRSSTECLCSGLQAHSDQSTH
jgi:hypothetical protein